MSYREVLLEREESPPDRPFAAVEKTGEDMGWIELMLARLQEMLPRGGGRYILQEDGRPHQIVLPRAVTLSTQKNLVVVGFFGNARQDSQSADKINEVDEWLIREFTASGVLLSYSSMLLPHGQWGNMPVFPSWEAMRHWRDNQRHAQAVRELAPDHYESIRLHTMEMKDGLSGNLELVRTKYYQYENGQLWMATRELQRA